MQYGDLRKRGDVLRDQLDSVQKFLGKSKYPTKNTIFLSREFNFLYSSDSRKELKRMLKIYYNVRAFTLRTSFHWVKIQLFLSRLHHFFSENYSLESHLGSKFIFLGNHRIRIFDGDIIYVIPKSDLDQELLSYEVGLRQVYKSPKFIPVMESRQGYFIEPCFYGTPLNRLVRKDQFSKDTFSKSLAESFYMTKNEYLGLTTQSLVRNRVMDDYSREFIRLLKNYLDSFQVSQISVRLSHGDYQEGNILVDLSTNDWRLTDWEFIDYRCDNYDYWVFRTGIRNKVGFKKIQSALNRVNMSRKYQMLMLIEEYRFTLENNFRNGYNETVDKVSYLNDLRQCLKVLR